MNVRIFGGFVLSAALGASLAGCETLHERLRKESVDESKHAQADDGEVDDDGKLRVLDVNSPKPKPFFKSSRLSGAMSDEGREIEKDLGIR